jgi:membrane protein
MAIEAGHPWHFSGSWLVRFAHRIRQGIGEHEIPIVSGALAYSATLAIFPALIALVSVYGLVASPDDVTREVSAMGSGVPQSTRELLLGLLQGVVQTSSGKLGGALIIGVVLALWSASSATATLIRAVSIAYDERDARGFLRRRALAFGLTFGVIVFGVIALFCIAVLPALTAHLGPAASTIVLVARWVLLAVLVWFALSALYFIVPRRRKPSLQGVSIGSTLGTILWIGVSLLFALFVSNFGRLGPAYGPLAGVIVLMLWFYLSSFVFLLGAEVSAESRRRPS